MSLQSRSEPNFSIVANSLSRSPSEELRKCASIQLYCLAGSEIGDSVSDFIVE
jgi:hypothetical protein